MQSFCRWKLLERACCFWSIFENSNPPPTWGLRKVFFCVKFPKKKPKTIFFSPKRLFQVFRLSTREMSFSNLALFENAQNLRDKFWNLVCENRVLASKRAPFCFWRFCCRFTSIRRKPMEPFPRAQKKLEAQNKSFRKSLKLAFFKCFGGLKHQFFLQIFIKRLCGIGSSASSRLSLRSSPS